MQEMSRVLVVSKNTIMVDNIRRWKSMDIDQGVLIIDHAKTKAEADTLAQQYKYDIVIQNGVHVIDIINKYQEGVEFAQMGKSKNNIFKHNIDAYSEEELNLLLTKTAQKPLKNGVKIEGWVSIAITALTLIVVTVIAYQSLRSDMDHTKLRIEKMEVENKNILEKIEKVNTSNVEMSSYFKAYLDHKKNSTIDKK